MPVLWERKNKKKQFGHPVQGHIPAQETNSKVKVGVLKLACNMIDCLAWHVCYVYDDVNKSNRMICNCEAQNNTIIQ